MKIKARPGEFYFKALIPRYCAHNEQAQVEYFGYELSDNFYSSEEEAKRDFKAAIWPAEEIEPNCIYVPSKEEMEEDI